MEVIRENFVTTFDLIERATGPDGLKRFEDGTHRGKVGLRAFEAIAVGISFNLDQILALADPTSFVRDRVRGFWNQPEIESFSAPGLRGTQRIQKTIPFGRHWFAP
jgi:hypothetical protein